MSTGPFLPRSVASLFDPDQDPRQNPVFGQFVQGGMDPETPAHLLGWIDSPDRHPMAASFCPPLAQAAPDLMTADTDKDIFLYRAWKEALGSYPKYVAQRIGDCTSFGSGHAIDLLQCVEMVAGHEPIEFQETCTEAIYGMGREIGNMLGGGDGCYGVAVSKALVTMGSVPRALVGPYDGQRAKRWGASGVPAEVKRAAAEFKVGASALITTCDELDAALANGYPAAGGFSQGFTMHRDSNGCCQQSGRWGHEEAFVARRRRNGRRQYLLLQSWGDNVPDGPTTDDQPGFSFWIDEAPMASILGQRDTTTFSRHPGFKRRPLPPEWSTAHYLI